jgi:hypothetical protein
VAEDRPSSSCLVVVIVIDNADFNCYSTAPSLMEASSRLEFAGLGVGRKDATKTDVYYRTLPEAA